jgi:hypothetical protein
MWYALSEARLPLNGPGAIAGSGALVQAAASNADFPRDLRHVNRLAVACSSCPMSYVSFSPEIFSE